VIVIGPNRRLPLTHVANCAECVAQSVACDAAQGQTFNVVDSDEVRAWSHAGALIRSRRIAARRRIAVPYHLGLWLAIAVRALARLLLGKNLKLPGILLPERYRARFRSLRFPNQKAVQRLGWQPRLRDELRL
jgi:UDP-glucose 4-epimerase